MELQQFLLYILPYTGHFKIAFLVMTSRFHATITQFAMIGVMLNNIHQIEYKIKMFSTIKYSKLLLIVDIKMVYNDFSIISTSFHFNNLLLASSLKYH